MRKAKSTERILSLILCLLMVFSAIPVHAAEAVSGNDGHSHEDDALISIAEMQENEDTDTDILSEDASDEEASTEKYEVTVAMNAVASKAKLYALTDGEKAEEDLLSDVTPTGSKYVKELAAGEYLLEGYNEDESIFYGSIEITVSAKETFQVFTVSGIRATNEGWTAGTDYSINATVMSKDMSQNRMAVLGSDGNSATLLCLYMDSVTLSFVPDKDLHPGYGTYRTSQTIYSNGAMSGIITQEKNITVNAPAGSVIQLVDGGTYYDYVIYEPESEESTDSGITAKFRVSSANALRVNHPDGVLTWKWYEGAGIEDGAVIDVSKDDLRIGNAYHIIRKGEGNNSLDQADVRLNINEKGYLNMQVGDTFEINSTRVWQAVYTYMNTNTGMPEFSYKVIDPVTGEDSDILQITPDAPYTWQADMTAKKEGTAIVLVTYDSMFDPMTMGGSLLSATWPENTGVFVVTVGAEESDVDTGMKINETLGFTSYKLAGEYIDAEMDILYFPEGTDGASYSFIPEEGSTVTILHPVLTEDSMTYSGGFGTENVSVNEETGEVTLTKLTTGRHIVKITDNEGKSTYQVISAKPVSYVITDAYDNVLPEDAEIPAGSEVKITFTGLYNPAEKQSSVYNFTSRVYVVDDEGNITYNRAANTMGVYTFNSTNQSITVTVPESWAKDTITLTGGIATSAFGGKMGIHRVIDYDTGLGQNAYNQEQRAHLCSLPEITLNVRLNDGRVDAIFLPTDGETALTGAKYTLTSSEGENITVQADGKFKVIPGVYKYSVVIDGYNRNLGEIEVTADGDNKFDIAMVKSSEYAWDGVTVSEPSKDADGAYLISSAAEYVWFVNAVNSGTISSYTALFTADIDFANHPFDAMKSLTSGNTIDGQNHAIYNLYVDKVVTGYHDSFGGLFNYVTGTLKNLTVNGTVKMVAGGIEGVHMGAIAGNLNSGIGVAQGGLIYNVTSNVDLYADVTQCSRGYVGGIAGYNYGGSNANVSTLERCVNNGNIVVTDTHEKATNPRYVGGIMGAAQSSINIIECVNNGDITFSKATSDARIRVGGITGAMGFFEGVANTVNRQLYGCYNTGNITATARGGWFAGIVAEVDRVDVDGVYNTGNITVTNTGEDKNPDPVSFAVYAIANKSSWVKNSYNLGEITATKGVKTFNAGGENSYYLNTSETTNDDGTAISANGLKIAYLGDRLLPVCDGYPQVAWEDASFHSEKLIGTVDPTCSENGGHTYSCANCGTVYVKYDIEPTGHTLCEHTGAESCEDHEYTIPTCVSQGKLVKTCKSGCGYEQEEIFDPVAHTPNAEGTKCVVCQRSLMVTPELVQVDSYDSFFWFYNEEEGRWQSNVNEDGAQYRKFASGFELTLPAGGTISFDYGCDGAVFQLFIDGSNIGRYWYKESGHYFGEIAPGTHKLKFQYSRSDFDAPEIDFAWVKNIVIHDHAGEVVATKENEISAPTCTQKGQYFVVCEECGDTNCIFTTDALGHTLEETCQEQSCSVCDATIILGHTYCAHTTEQLCIENPECEYHTYTPATCKAAGSIVQVCTYGCGEEKITVLNNQPAHIPAEDGKSCETCGIAISTVDELTVAEKDPWFYDEEDGRWESPENEDGGDKISTTASFTLDLPAGGNVAFDYGCMTGQTVYFYGALTVTSSDGTATKTHLSNVCNKDNIHCVISLPAGTHTIYLKFDEILAGNGFAWVDNITVHNHIKDGEIAEEDVILAPTCTESGSYRLTCSDCGEAGLTAISEALGHDIEETVVDSTCTAGGYTDHVCLREGCEFSERTDGEGPLGHNYEGVVTKPTEEEGGYTTYTCGRCGDSYVDDYVSPVSGVEVYFSASHDEKFLVGEASGEVMALSKLTVPYFDLAIYGLDGYYLDGSAKNAEGKVTILHMLIWATEIYQYGLSEDEAGKGFLRNENIIGTKQFSVSQTAGSMKIDHLWGMDMNMNYYHNMEYPLAFEGWGTTADQIVLKPGDVVTLGHFTSWDFYVDTSSVYNYLTPDGEAVIASAEYDKEISLYVYRAGANMAGDYGTAHEPVKKALDVYYAPVDELTDGDVTGWTKLGTTDEEGMITLNTADLGMGEYIIAVEGRYGNEFKNDICSTPGAILLSVEHTHSFGEWTVTKESSCSEEGTEERTCGCGKVETRKVEKLAHTEEIIPSVEATCTSTGLTEGRKCTVCGETTVEQTTVQKKEHKTKLVGAIEATCEKGGYTGVIVCEVCERQLATGKLTDAKGHTFGEWTVVTEATCKEAGSEVRKCACGKEETREVAKLAHTEESIPGKAATCTEAGLTEGKKCTVCGAVTVKQTEIAALGHKEEIIPGKPATETETGLTDGKKCSVCGEIIVKQEEIPVLEKEYVLGDANLDGEVDAKDATQILRFVNGKASSLDKMEKEEMIAAADVNGDKEVDAKDATQILRFVNGKASALDKQDL